ncbi:MAG: tripartite tricarboxylate transporter substrate-binding protein [Aureibaculum sp.]|nr:tripartite tricarboxylate transporter substrate-binding protein [Aureibaculum sp.]
MASLFILIYIGLMAYLYLDLNSGEAYPNKPITIIVHSKPGSSIDLMSRKVAELSRKYSDAPFVVENRPGTQGVVAMNYVMDRDADGYTLLGVTKSFISTVIVNKSDITMSDFQFLANMISDPEALISNRENKWGSINDIVSQANEMNGKQVWLGPGTGGRDHLMALKTWEALGIKAQWVDYKSGPQSILAMLRNEAPIYVGNPSDILGKKQLQIIAIAADKRLEALPDVPTLKESGYDLNESMWRGFAFKKGVSQNAVAYVSDVMKKISEDKEWQTYCKEVYSFSDYLDPDTFSEKINYETGETIEYLEKAGLLNSYVKEGKLPLWSVAILLVFIVAFLIVLIVKFDIKKINYSIILSGIFIWVAGLFYYQTLLFEIPKGLNITSPALIPTIWVVALFVFAVWNIINELTGKRTTQKKGNLKILGKILIALLIYFIAIPQIGYFLSTPLFLIGGMYIMNYRKWSLMIINAFGFVLFSYLVFDLVLRIELPLGNMF